MGLFGKKPSEIEKNLERYYAEQEKKAAAVIMYCPKCGGEVEEDDICCNSCGCDTDEFPPITEKPTISKPKKRTNLITGKYADYEAKYKIRTDKNNIDDIWQVFYGSYIGVIISDLPESEDFKGVLNFELIPYLYVLTELCLQAKGYFEFEIFQVMAVIYQHITNTFLASSYPYVSKRIELGNLEERINLYRQIISQRKVKGLWLVKDADKKLVKEIKNKDKENDFLRLLVAFGDILLSPSAYDSDFTDKQLEALSLIGVTSFMSRLATGIQNIYIKNLYNAIY